MKWSKVIAVAACLLTLTVSACTADDGDNSSQPTESPASTSEPTLSAAEAKRLAAEEAARQKAIEKEAQNWVAAIEKVVKTETSPPARLSIIITEYCKIIRDPDEVETAKGSLLRSLYAKYWQAGRWNSTLPSAASQPGACPELTPQFGG